MGSISDWPSVFLSPLDLPCSLLLFFFSFSSPVSSLSFFGSHLPLFSFHSVFLCLLLCPLSLSPFYHSFPPLFLSFFLSFFLSLFLTFFLLKYAVFVTLESQEESVV